MALGTRGGNLLLKDARLQTGCACCGEQACGCGLASDVRPVSLTIEFSGFSFEQVFVSTPGSAEGQESALNSYIAGLGEIELPLFVPNFVSPLATEFFYGTLGCSSSQIGSSPAGGARFKDVTCAACPSDFYANAPVSIGVVATASAPSIQARLSCDGSIVRRDNDGSGTGGVPERWTFWKPLVLDGNNAWQPSECGNDASWDFKVFFPNPASVLFQNLPLSVTPLCDGQFSPVEIVANITCVVAALAGDQSGANYVAAGGSLRITPNYGNPLP